MGLSLRADTWQLDESDLKTECSGQGKSCEDKPVFRNRYGLTERTGALLSFKSGHRKTTQTLHGTFLNKRKPGSL
jgi:hypothetical protein